jgi:hypothetical protein
LSVPGIKATVFNCLLNHRNLGLVQFEVDDLPRFHFPAGEFLLHFRLELMRVITRAAMKQPCSLVIVDEPE